MFQRQIVKLSVATLILISGTLSAFADLDISGGCMRLCAEARTNPPQIIISWGSVPAGVLPAESYQIQRSEQPPVTLSADTLSYTDTNVVAGELYTYQVSKQPNTDANGVVYISAGYITAGVALPLVESRGKLILIVDSDNAAGLSSELTRLTYDLAGDGWTVIRHDVSPASSAPDVRALIQADYNNDPTNVKCVFLFGRIPVAMSGYYNPDGHHLRALPTDGYYGDMDGVWTDIVDYGDDNMAGDGKFDAVNMAVLPSAVELAIGRVDLRSMPSFTKSETELLRQYLDKDHNYRHKLFLAREQAIIDDHFGNYARDVWNGWRNFPLFVGPTNVLINNSAWSSAIDVPYHWAYGGGPGNYTTVSGVTTTPQLQNADPGVFTILFGSYFLEWQVADNVMRAVLCTSNYGLTCLWGEWNSLYFNKMAYGEPIGVCMRDMMGRYSRVERALMGDPTLRYHIVAPPSGLQVVSAGGGADLTWSASSEPVLGYHVYRAANVTGEFTRVNTDVISGTAYHDPAPPEKCIYMVRAITLTEGKSGSYFNASQGIFAQFEALSVPETPAGVTASDGVYNDKVLVTWNAAGYAVGYQIWRSVDNNPSTAIMIGESHEPRFEDTTAVTETSYYYWIKATNSVGESAFSAADSGYSLMEIPLPPEGLTASDGTWSNKVAITWRESIQAMGYEIWRNLSNDPDGAALIGTAVTTNYDDVTAPADTLCYYWIKAVNTAGASVFSASDSGFRFTLGSPTVSISQGTYSNKIIVTWSAVPSALGYEIWRSESPYVQTALFLADTVLTNIEDTNVSLNTFYFYWVRATNAVGQGAFAGWYRGYGIPPPPPPQQVTASDGLYADKVVVSWVKVTNVIWSAPIGYKVWRSQVNDPATAEHIATTNGVGYTNYVDTSVELETPYYYWITATNTVGVSKFSLSDSGYRSMNCAPASPSSISASSYTYTNKIAVIWTAVTNATGYELWRGTNYSLANAILLTSTVGTTFDDATAVKDNYYYYSVRATNVFGMSSFNGPAIGIYKELLKPLLPAWVRASHGTYTDKVEVAWAASSDASGYAVYFTQPSGYVLFNALSIYATPETTYVDMNTNIEAGRLYRYCIVPTNEMFGATVWSTYSSDLGWKAGISPSAPSNVYASAGVFTDRVEISWSATGATYYQVYRSVSNENESISTLGFQTSLTHVTDTNVVAGVSYSYWVSAQVTIGQEYISSNVVGWSASLSPPAGTLQFSASSASINENGGTVTITVTRTGGSDGTATVNYATAGGTATAGSDYTTASGTLSWADGDAASKTFTVSILNDTTYEGNETFTATLSGATGATLGSPSSVTVTIVEDDPVPPTGQVQLSAAAYSVNENDGTVTITATRTGGSDGAATVNYATAGGTATAGSDYTTASGALSWADGDAASKTFTVSITDDSSYEGNETFTVSLSGASGASLGSPSSSTVTITDNESPPAGSIGLSTSTLTYARTYGSVTPSNQTLVLTNSGQAGFRYSNTVSYGSGSGWFMVAPVTGQVAGSASQVMTGTVSSAGLIVGVYVATNTIHSPDATNSPQYLVVTLTVSKANQAISFINPGALITTNTVGLSATSSAGLAVSFSVGNGLAQITGGTNLSFTGAGAVSILASQAGNTNWNTAPNVTNTFNVSKATASVVLGNLSQVYDGSAKSATATTAPSGLSVTLTYNGSATAPSAAGSYAVTAIVNSAMYQGSASGILIIGKSAQAITFPAISAQLTTNLVSLAATASSGLPVSFTVASGSARITGGILSFTGAGSVSIVAIQGGNATWNAAAPVTNTFTVTKVAAIVTLGHLSQTYDGSVKSATVTTAPSGLSVTLTYNGSATAPTAVGSYVVTGVVNSAMYQGSASGTLTIGNGRPPSIPTGVSASDGIYVNKVMVYWTALSSATSYKIWRGIDNNSQNASMLGTVTASFYLDTSTTPDVLYYYWIQAVDVTGTSDLSISDSGYCGLIVNLPSPTGVQASDGSYTDRIRITWQAVSSATRYEVWRNTENNRSAASLISDMTGTSYDDYSISPGICYYYWLKARTAHRDGNFSASDAGWRRLNTPSGVSASDGTYPYHIRVVWNVVANAAWYEVWREEVPGRNSDGGNLTKVTQTGDLCFNDYYTKSGVYYNYKVKACNELGSSLDYGHDTGYRRVNAASTLLPALNDYDGDKLSDLALFNSSAGVLDVLCSALGRQIFPFGAEINDGSSGDLDGDGLDDPVAYCTDSGTWLVSLSSIYYTPVIQARFGGQGNTVATADYDGDGLADLSTHNETYGVLSVMFSNGGTYDRDASCSLGGPGYRPVSADYDGDGLADPAVYSESEGRLTVMFSGNEYSSVSVALGGQGQAMYAADFDGDGLADPVLYEQITGIWTILLSSAGYSEAGISFGGLGYVPAIGDYDGDGLADPAIYRQSDGQWLIMLSGSGYTVINETFGKVGLKLVGR